MSQDTPQQARLMRSKAGRTARAVRKLFPVGTRVTSSHPSNTASALVGTVKRHVPAANGQGGHLVVEWDNGHTGNVSPIAIRVVE